MKGEEEQVRAALVRALEADLVGPFDHESGQEVLPLAPTRWYLTGFLAPRTGAELDADDQDAQDELAAGTDAQSDDAGAPEPEPKRRQFFPSSIGLSVFLPAPEAGQPDVIRVEVAYADYAPIDWPVEGDKPPRRAWRRRPVGPVRVTVPLDEALLGDPGKGGGVPVPDSDGLRLRGELRTTRPRGPAPRRPRAEPLPRQRATRGARGPRRELRLPGEDDALPRRGSCLGPPGAASTPPTTTRACSRSSSATAPSGGRPQHQRYAAGDRGDGAVRRLATTQLPRYEVRTVKHEDVPGFELGMLALYGIGGRGGAGEGALGAAGHLRGVDRAPAPNRRRRRAAGRHARSRDEPGRGSAQRIVEGIELLAADEELRTAFRWANRAMHVAAMQMDRQRDDRRYGEDAKPAWRPFQLAFVLLNIASVADPATSTAGRRT